MKPIIIFDLETTGVDIANDRIVQIATIKIRPERVRMDSTELIVLNDREDLKSYLINPDIPIPASATETHGITDEMVNDKFKFPSYAKALFDYFKGCDIAGYNSNKFDVPLLSEEFARCGITFPEAGTKLIDAYNIFAQKEKRDLTAALKFYCDKEMEGSHDAGNDVMATYEVLKAQLIHYQDIGEMDLTQLSDFCGGATRVDLAGTIVLNDKGVAIYNIGKDKGKTIWDNPGFARWMLKPEQSFTSNTKAELKAILGILI